VIECIGYALGLCGRVSRRNTSLFLKRGVIFFKTKMNLMIFHLRFGFDIRDRGQSRVQVINYKYWLDVFRSY